MMLRLRKEVKITWHMEDEVTLSDVARSTAELVVRVDKLDSKIERLLVYWDRLINAEAIRNKQYLDFIELEEEEEEEEAPPVRQECYCVLL
jgi:hypothetical protein